MKLRLLPYKFTRRHGLFNTLLFAPIRRILLAEEVKRTKHTPDSITIVIGIRNRNDHRLRNALWSIANQNHPKQLTKIIVVDYGSNEEQLTAAIDLCNKFNAEIIFLTASTWNKSKCLNYAIKRANTKFILSTDADVILPLNYISEMIASLKAHPLSAIYSRMMDLPDSKTDELRLISEMNLPVPFESLFHDTVARGPGHENAGINGTYTAFYQYIRGYDELYEGWGSEDNDLMSRFIRLGLDIISISKKASYLHQWHPKGEGIPYFGESAKRNREYYQHMKSIRRNKSGWGNG